MKRIDAHQHFWRYSPARYGWIAPGSTLARDRMPEDVKPLLDSAAVDGCIAVQAEQDEVETDWLLACFGPERLMFGSDWPVCTLAAEYPCVLALIEDFVQRACPAYRDAVFGGTAMRAYTLSEPIA